MLDDRNLELEALEADLKNVVALKDEEIEQLRHVTQKEEPDYQAIGEASELRSIAQSILSSLKLGSQSPQYKSVKRALSQFVGALTKTEESTPSSSTQLTHKEMMLRLGVPTSTLSQWKIKDGFPEWSRERDPEGIAWQWEEGLKRFIPTNN